MATTAEATSTLAQSRGTQPPPRAPRATTAKPPAPMTLRQVIESLSSSRNPKRVEDLIAKAGVQFQATPAVVDILTQFGASPKLISMIPVPPPPPPPPPPPEPAKPKLAGPLTIICEPGECSVVVDGKYEGETTQNRATVSGLDPSETTVRIFADGYETLSRRITLEEGKPAEVRFSLKRSAQARRENARASLLRTVASLGGLDGILELADIEVEGVLQWLNSSGAMERWMVTFKKRAGRNLTATFKTTNGNCTASILAQTAKQECKGELRNGGASVAEQATALFLSYQLHDVIDALLQRPLIASEMDEGRLESFDAKDSYTLTIGDDGLPSDLVYRIGDSDSPIHVQYSKYLMLNKGRYPGQISVGRLNSAPAWVFTLTTARSRVVQAR